MRITIQNLRSGDTRSLFGANGAQINIVGKVNISVKLGGLSVPYDFYVVSNLYHDMLIGADFLLHTKSIINYSDNSITFFDDLVRLPSIDGKRKIVATISQNFELPPRTESLVSVKVSGKILCEGVFLFEPLEMRENQKYLVASSVAPIFQGKSFCRIMNPTNQIIHLRTKLPKAQIKPVDINYVSYTHLDPTRHLRIK